MVGALSAMGVFNMGDRTDNQTDPTLTNFMPVFDALDEDAQALVLKNANPLDLDSMTAVTNTVDAIEALTTPSSSLVFLRRHIATRFLLFVPQWSWKTVRYSW